MESSKKVSVEEDLYMLLLQGRFEDCVSGCSDYFTSHMLHSTRLPQNAPTLVIPVVDFDAKDGPNDAHDFRSELQVCLVYMQALYELSLQRGDQNYDQYKGQLLQIEAALNKYAPIPFQILLTWIQLLLEFQDYEKAKQILTFQLNLLAKEIHQNKLAPNSADKCRKYAILANLYTVYALPKLGQLASAQRFIAMHNNGTLLNHSQRSKMLQSLETYSSGGSKGVTSQDASGSPPSLGSLTDNGVPTTEEPSRSNNQDSTGSNGTSNTVEAPKEDTYGEIVISVEQAAGIVATAAVLFFVYSKRDSIKKLFRTSVENVGDAIFGK